MDVSTHQSAASIPGTANFLLFVHNDNKHILIFSGDSKLLVDEVVKNLNERGIYALPFENMGNVLIAIPDSVLKNKEITTEEFVSIAPYINKDIYTGSPLEAGIQMQAEIKF